MQLKSLALFFLLVYFHSINAQEKIHFSVQAGTNVAYKGRAPFWLFSNQYGKISPRSNSLYLLPSIYKSFSKEKKLDYQFKLEPLLRYNGIGRSYMHQWYLSFKFKFVEIYGGAKEEVFGNQDSSLSSGGMLWSGNARPMPKVSIGVPYYTVVPFTWKYLEFKGGIAHGWFGDNEYNKNVWLHHKYFYLRLGGKLPVHMSYGLHHFAQWGGTYNGMNLPHDFKAFKDIFFAKSGNSADPNTPPGESINSLGNHIGSRNFGLEGSFKKFDVSLYWQTIFEDGSGKAYRNIKDGLFGIAIHTKDKNKLINGFVYEFVNTTDQSGRYNLKPGDTSGHEYGGNDNYFNNAIYLKGWSFKEMTIGNALITSPVLLNGNEKDYLRNNRVLSHHFGIEGSTLFIFYKVIYNYSLNYGTNFFPLTSSKSRHSFYIYTTPHSKLAGNLTLSSSISIDFGKFLGNRFGFLVTVSKKGFL